MLPGIKKRFLAISLATILSVIVPSGIGDYSTKNKTFEQITQPTSTTNSTKHEKVEITNAYVVSKVTGEAVASSNPKYPTIDDDVNLFLVLRGKMGGETTYFSEISDIIIDENVIPKNQITKWDTSYGNINIDWFKVEPIDRNLSNISDKRWRWAKIRYAETPFAHDKWNTKADVNPTYLSPQNGRGTMRFKVRVEYWHLVLSSPGAESYGKTGIDEKVHRISIRGNTGIPIVDWGYTLMNLPYIWGSASPTGDDEHHQAETYQGFDCADFVIAVARKAGHNIRYGGNHNLLPANARKYTTWVVKTPVLGPNGVYYTKEGQEVRIGDDNVKLGDIVLYNRHAGILTKDLPPCGYLSTNDLVLHTLFKEPREEQISNAYSPPFSIVRFRERRRL